MELNQQEASRSPHPVIAIPSYMGEDYLQRLSGLKNGRIVEQANPPYVDVGKNTLVHLVDARVRNIT